MIRTLAKNKAKNKAKMPIIAMTTDVLIGEHKKCYAVGMNDFIEKPFDTQVLFYYTKQ